jgi:hypothetical protein
LGNSHALLRKKAVELSLLLYAQKAKKVGWGGWFKVEGERKKPSTKSVDGSGELLGLA